MASPLDVVVRFIGDNSSLDAAAAGSKGTLSAFGHTVDTSGIAKVAAFAGVAGVAAGAIIEMTSAAAADRDEQARLTTAIRAATGSTADYTDEVNAAIAAGQEKAFTDTQTRDALQSLVTATGDVGQATALLATAQDVARFAGVDLATAADAVAKAQAGSATQLQRLIPGLEKGASASDTLAAAQAAAAGQADAFAASTAGQSAMVSDGFAELSETIGSVFLPILDALLPAILPIIKSLGELVTAILPLLIPLIQALASALTVAGKVLGIVVGWVVQLVKLLADAIVAVGRFVDALNPLKGFKLPSLPFLSSAGLVLPAPAGRGLYATAAPAGGSPVTVNVYGSDPDQVVSVIARWAGHNGGSASFIRRLDRG